MKDVIENINNLSNFIKTTCESVNSFKQNPLILEVEDHVYQVLAVGAQRELKLEVDKAKELYSQRKNKWLEVLWTMIKNPLMIFFGIISLPKLIYKRIKCKI